jgi:hypothetical protein
MMVATEQRICGQQSNRKSDYSQLVRSNEDLGNDYIENDIAAHN